MKLVASMVALPLVLAWSATAAAQDNGIAPGAPAGSNADVFGAQGQLAISSDTGLSISNTSVSGQSGSTTRLVLAPSVDYFIVDSWSVGGFVSLDYTTTPGSSTTTFAIGPRVGYDLALTRIFTVWPKAGFSFRSTNLDTDETVVEGETVPGQSDVSNALALNLFVPLMFHPAAHFFIGFGPALDVDLTGDNKATTIAGRLTLGGWL